MTQHQPELTAQPDTHFQHVFHNLPDWVLTTSPVTRRALKSARLDIPDWHTTATRQQHQALKTANTHYLTQRNQLESMLDKLQNARDFAEPLLQDALRTRYGLDLDVKTTFLRLYIPQTIPWFPIKTGAARTWTVSLLDAALHNFQDSETEAEAYESTSTFITEPSPTGQFDTLPTIKRQLSIQSFTRLCRELDIGGRYQAHLKENLGFNNSVAEAVLKSSAIKTHKAALLSALHMAQVRGDLPLDANQSILDIIEGRENVGLDNWRLHCHDLSLMSSLLTGIVIFAPRLDLTSQRSRIIAYIPDDPEHPLKQYPDTQAFMAELTRKLRAPAYQAFFSRFIDHQERGHFFADLNTRLSAVTWHEHQQGDPLPSWRDTPIDKPNLQFSVSSIRNDLWTHLYQQQSNKILNDARSLAVSTASADRTARWAAWDAFSNVAKKILEVASFVALPFVPLLGEVMLGYMAYQVLDDTFEGIIDWAEGLKTEAFGHLMTIVETVVELGTFAVGGVMAANAFNGLMSREAVTLISPLKPVETATGKTRYWKPDLTPYEQSVDLPDSATRDHLGVYQHEGKTLVRVEDKLYSIKPDSKTGRFQIQHPNRADAYQPALRHNNHGAWQTMLERPLTWDRQTVLRRIGQSVESFNTAEREQILQISGFHDNVLREIHVENQRPPSLLTDTIKRFKIDRDIQALVEQTGSEHPDRYQALNQRSSLFQSRYRELEKTDDRHVQLLQGEVRGLPTDIAQELVSNATGTELKQMHSGRLPQRLKDVALKAMDAVRIARAYEGFYLEGMETADTHRLALHTLESLSGWPARLRIEVREFSHEGTLRDSIGQPDARLLRTLVYGEDGTYNAHENTELAGNFYQAILQALPETERAAMGLSAEDGPILKQRIVRQAQNKPELRTLLAKHPNRKPFYDPTTMRLPGGTEGYHRIGRPTPTLNDRVREVYPSLPQDELRAIVARLQRHPDGARVELSRLSNEMERLHEDLRTWMNEAPTVHPETRLPLNELEQQAQRHNRRLLAQEIQRSWRRQSDRDLDSADNSDRYVLRFADPILGDLPVLTADFSHVSLLALEGSRAEQGIHGFLQRFNNLRRLDLRGFSLSTLPEAIPRMTNLDALLLHDCAIRFDADAWSKMSSLNKLVMLDLFRNPVDAVPDVGAFTELVHLDLSETGLTEIPASAITHPKLNTLMLVNNRITELPAGLFDSTVYDKRGVHLSDNPLIDSVRQRIKLHYLETSYDLGVYAPQADIERVRALYPNMEVEQASEFVYELPGTLEEGRIELTRLEAELAKLSNDLAAWTADLPPLHPRTGEPFNERQLFVEHANRDEFMQTLQQCWRHQSDLDDFNDSLEPTFDLVITSRITGELPTLSADFSHVSALELQSVDGVTRIGRFLDVFPNLKSLRLRECDLGTLPEAVFKMGRLRSLSLYDCRITLSAESANALAGMEQLDYLDLSLNPLGQTPDLSQMKGLATVLFADTGITEVPRGLLQLEELDWADLSDNAITDIPSDIMEVPVEVAENINLRGNPFSEESVLRLIDYFESTGTDFNVEDVINRGEMQLSSTEGSEVDE
ncbi:dermonecrotic toxin domain-containing protein [Pseudomonas sp. O230]|uniref:dermonecrotic toxin domain-containing protein n=1 Tax=Pseudomonas sp. O230 TaxID=3159450 RepID=UPI00387B0A47